MTSLVAQLAQEAQQLSSTNVNDIRIKLNNVELDLSCNPTGAFGAGIPSPEWEAWASAVIALSTPDINDLGDEMGRIGHIKPSRLIRTT